MSKGEEEIRAAFAAAEDVTPTDDVPPELPPVPPEGEPAPSPDKQPPERTCAGFPLNDTGNGRRFRVYFGDDVIKVPRVGWFTWTGKVWLKDEDELAVRALGQELGERITGELVHVTWGDREAKLLRRKDEWVGRRVALEMKAAKDRTSEEDAELVDLRGKLGLIAEIEERLRRRRQSHASFAKTTGNSQRIDSALKEGGVGLSRPLSALDAGPLDLNTESGVLRFTASGTGAERSVRFDLVPHERYQLLTKLMPVEYDPAASCPGFEAFLQRIMPDVDMRYFLQRWFGLSATGLTGDQKLAFLYGTGANGKSVLMDLMARLLGPYAATAKIQSLTGTNRRSAAEPTPDLIPLMGARLVRASEPEEGERLQEAMIKELTGGEPILVRALHSDFIEVKPQFKLTISGNHKPEIRGTDDGIWRRVLLVPFEVQIPTDERDPDLGKKLWEERSGILNWLVAGLVDYLEIGLCEPEKVSLATRAYREESDPIQVFLDQCCEVTGSEGDFTGSKDLVEAVNFWLVEQGMSRWKERTITLRLADKAERWRDPRSGLTFTKAKRSISGYTGLRLLDTFANRMRSAAYAAGRSASAGPDPF